MKKVLTTVGIGLALASAFVMPSFAQADIVGGGSMVGQTKASPGCPSVVLHILRNATQISGVAFYADGSGVSQVQGAMGPNNTFAWHQTSISGNGPPGDVTGTLEPNGALKVQLVGTTCTFETVLPLLPTYGVGNG